MRNWLEQLIYDSEPDDRQDVSLKSLALNTNIVQAEEFSECHNKLQEEETRTKAGLVESLMSQINSEAFQQSAEVRE